MNKQGDEVQRREEIEKRYTPSKLVWDLDGTDVENFRTFVNVRIARMNACIINKLPVDDELKSVLDKVLEKMDADLNAEKIGSYAWLCKAVLLRNLQPYAERTLCRVIQLLNSDNAGVAAGAVDALRVILDDNPVAPLLSARSGALTSLLAKQRIFNRSVDLLTNAFENCGADQKRYYFQALHIILTHAPKNAQCESEIDKLLPLLLNSIQSEDENVLTSSVDSLKQLVTNANSGSSQKLHPHIPTLCSRLVELAKAKTSPMDLRASCLDCVTELADGSRIPLVILNPWRDQILKQLAPCLDDRKRTVRAKAVAARNKWFLLG